MSRQVPCETEGRRPETVGGSGGNFLELKSPRKAFSSNVGNKLIQSENKLKFNFQGHCTLTFHVQMSACVFRSKERVNNTSVMKCLELNF